MSRVCDPSSCELLKLKSDFGLEIPDKDFTEMTARESELYFSGFEPLSLIRRDTLDKSVFGVMYFRGVFLCDTLENADYLIKDGVYSLELTYSPKFKANRYEITGVPDRSRLLIHEGNYYSDSKGCPLVGVASQPLSFLRYSVVTLQRIMRVIRELQIQTIKIY